MPFELTAPIRVAPQSGVEWLTIVRIPCWMEAFESGLRKFYSKLARKLSSGNSAPTGMREMSRASSSPLTEIEMNVGRESGRRCERLNDSNVSEAHLPR